MKAHRASSIFSNVLTAWSKYSFTMSSEKPSSSISNSSIGSNTLLSMGSIGGVLPTRLKDGSVRVSKQPSEGRAREWAIFQHTSLTAAGGELPALVTGGVLGGIDPGDALWVDEVDVIGA